MNKFNAEKRGEIIWGACRNMVKLLNLDNKETLILFKVGKDVIKQNKQPPKYLYKEWLTRYALIVIMYNKLYTIFQGMDDRVVGWFRAPNKASLFNGKSAFEVIDEGDENTLYKIVCYLNSYVN